MMELKDKVDILAAAAKYDVSCSSSGSSREGERVHWAMPIWRGSAIAGQMTGAAFLF
jgi:predicted DNA-binding helix-hairpin-helix protein